MYSKCVNILLSLVVVMTSPVMQFPPPCSRSIHNRIMHYWSFAWPPDNVTLSQFYYSSGRMRLIAGTASLENSSYKCRILNFYPSKVEHGIQAVMEFENDGIKETRKVREEGGQLFLPGYAVAYNIIVNRGVYAAYLCRESGGDGMVPIPTEAGGAAGDIREPEAWVAAVDEANKTDIKNALGVMELIGLSLEHDFNCSDAITGQPDLS